MEKNKYKVTRKNIENSPINYNFTEVAIKNVANRKSAYNINELQQENKYLKRLLNATEKMETISVKGFKKLNEENKELKEQVAEQIDYKDEYYHYWQETKKELAQFTDYLDRLGFNNFNDFEEWMGTFMLTPHEEQTLIKELKEQLAIREKALELACQKITYYEIEDKESAHFSQYWWDNFIEQAKESIDNDNTN